MITVKDYAETHGKTVQAVYQQMKRKTNAQKLEGHIYAKTINNKKVNFLDDEAVAILEESSNFTPVVIRDQNQNARIQQLEQENKVLLISLNESKDSIIAVQAELKEVQSQLLIAERSEAERKDELDRTRSDHQRELQQRDSEIEELKKLLQSEQERKLTFKERLFGKKKGNAP